MRTPISIVDVELDGPDGVLITISDSTVAGYIVEEMLALRPQREVSGERTSGPRSVIRLSPVIDRLH